MAIGSIINLGGGGGSLGGKGMIIVDTATMTAGDVVRVRDVFDSQNVQNKSVVTAGTPLYFEVNPYCYYKVCTVQTIDDTPTEIGGMYTTIDVGQTVYVNVLNKTTIVGLKGILNAHQENDLLNVGDIINAKVGGEDVELKIYAINLYNSHELIVGCSQLWTMSAYNSYAANYFPYTDSLARQAAQSFYTAMTDEDKQCVNTMERQCRTNVWVTFTDKVWIPNWQEVFGGADPSGMTPTIPRLRFPIFTTQANRIKTYNNTVRSWLLTDTQTGYGNRIQNIDTSGNGITSGDGNMGDSRGILPCFQMLADS